jgi:hypothetical protein
MGDPPRCPYPAGGRERVEEEAPPLVRANTYLGPFALRALGCVRGDRKLLEQAVARFEEVWLRWHAARTRDLLQAPVQH